MKWDEISPIALIVAMIGTTGAGAFFRELVDVFTKLKSGMSARESKRKVDIVEQRDEAIAREKKAWSLVDREAEKRRQEQEYSARLRRQIIALGGEPGQEPAYEETITKAQLTELREKEQP